MKTSQSRSRLGKPDDREPINFEIFHGLTQPDTALVLNVHEIVTLILFKIGLDESRPNQSLPASFGSVEDALYG